MALGCGNASSSKFMLVENDLKLQLQDEGHNLVSPFYIPDASWYDKSD